MPYANIPSNHISCEYGDQVMIPCEHNEDSQVKLKTIINLMVTRNHFLSIYYDIKLLSWTL